MQQIMLMGICQPQVPPVDALNNFWRVHEDERPVRVWRCRKKHRCKERFPSGQHLRQVRGHADLCSVLGGGLSGFWNNRGTYYVLSQGRLAQ